MRDVTEQKLLGEQLRQSQKLEAVGLLAAGIAHDFNNILTAILGYSSILETSIPPEDSLHDSVEEIIAAAKRAAQLTEGLLLFSRKKTRGNMEILDLNEAVRRSQKLLTRMIGEDIELCFEPSAGEVLVLADRVQIEQILMNLVSNARDAMPNGGMVRLCVTTEAVGSSPQTQRVPPGTYARIDCVDSGTGMDQRTKERLFEPFFTTKEVGKGTGLGLSIVWGIVEQHRGFITVESTPGGGTAFRLRFPLASTQTQNLTTSEEEAPRSGSETIFVVEDDAQVRSLLRTSLEQYGYTVLEAEDGLEALRRFAEWKDRIHATILDVVMPKMDGRLVYSEIRKHRPDMKVIFVSGYAPETIQSRGMPHEERRILHKPFTAVELARTVRTTLDA